MGKSSDFDKDEVNSARSIISSLMRKGVKLLALDFDKTIVSVHTAGFWKQGAAKLAEYVRPSFRALIRAGLESNLDLCIVTHSTQPALIQDVLELALPDSNVRAITIRASTKDWMPATRSNGGANGANLGKEQHISWVITYLFNRKHLIIHPHEIFLIDDDFENVEIAREFGHRAYYVTEDVSLGGIKHFVDSIDAVHVARSRSFVTVKEGKSSSKREKRIVGASGTPPMGVRAVAMREAGGRAVDRQCISYQGPHPGRSACQQCECDAGLSREVRPPRH